MLRILVIFCLALGVSGCIASPAALSPSTIPVKDGEYTVLAPADGYAWGAMLLAFPLTEAKQAKTARDRALQSVEGCDGLVNVSMSHIAYLLGPLILTQPHVHGDAFKFTQGSVSQVP